MIKNKKLVIVVRIHYGHAGDPNPERQTEKGRYTNNVMRSYNPRSRIPFFVFVQRAGGMFCLLTAVFMSGCAYMVSSTTGNMADGIAQAILDNDDPATVAAGMPAYLLMIDGLVNSNPEDPSLLRTAARLYSAYAGLFVQDSDRAGRLSEKALNYGLRAVCVSRDEICAARQGRFKAFEEAIQKTGAKDVPSLYALGSAWAGWIQAHSQDMNAIAQLSRVEAVMQRIVELDESYQDGGAHVYLGALATLLPPAIGGKPEVGRRHFERAIELSAGKNLMAKVVYADRYARLVFDRDLHDRLLQQVLAAEPRIPGYTLTNMFARRRARELLDDADEYF
jgi:hypothetical protein